MFMKTSLTAAALATAIAAGTATLPASAANAAPQIDFNISIDTGNGTISFGTGGAGYGPMSCWQAKNHLKGDFKKVSTVECNGAIYTFQVKKFNFGPWKTVKLNRNTGNYWIV